LLCCGVIHGLFMAITGCHWYIVKIADLIFGELTGLDGTCLDPAHRNGTNTANLVHILECNNIQSEQALQLSLCHKACRYIRGKHE
jgi:hypothetical protein